MSEKDFNIVVCASGVGGNFQSLIDNSQRYGYTIKKLIVNKECGAIQKAESAGIPYELVDKNKLGTDFSYAFERAIPADTELIVLAGFLPIIPAYICEKWGNKIINIHPSLLPKYGGKGMYGERVQEAVLKAKETIAGCSVHYVNSAIDAGSVIMQHSVPVELGDTPHSLGQRIYKHELEILPLAVKKIKEERSLY